jgi:hypothetical protein
VSDTDRGPRHHESRPPADIAPSSPIDIESRTHTTRGEERMTALLLGAATVALRAAAALLIPRHRTEPVALEPAVQAA